MREQAPSYSNAVGVVSASSLHVDRLYTLQAGVGLFRVATDCLLSWFDIARRHDLYEIFIFATGFLSRLHMPSLRSQGSRGRDPDLMPNPSTAEI